MVFQIMRERRWISCWFNVEWKERKKLKTTTTATSPPPKIYARARIKWYRLNLNQNSAKKKHDNRTLTHIFGFSNCCCCRFFFFSQYFSVLVWLLLRSLLFVIPIWTNKTEHSLNLLWNVNKCRSFFFLHILDIYIYIYVLLLVKYIIFWSSKIVLFFSRIRYAYHNCITNKCMMYKCLFDWSFSGVLVCTLLLISSSFFF